MPYPLMHGCNREKALGCKPHLSGDGAWWHSRTEHRHRQSEFHPLHRTHFAWLVPLPMNDEFKAVEGHMDDSAYGKSQLLWQLRDKVTL